ncbi:hypothetical protein ACFWOX_04720 [Streptomyces sp. NPDC058467]|uniref:hypothetical protein n=1 Tax=Streptomyces sp. NPDC058467 TaxID=3346513 RepID=UPI003649C1BC
MAQLGVALVSAGSALTGAVIGGVFTLLKGRQEVKERIADRQEQRRQQRLNARRTAYVDFLKEVSQAEDELAKLYEFQVPGEPGAWDSVGNQAVYAYNRLFQAQLEVEMVGPRVMAAQAERVLERVHAIMAKCDDIYEEHKERVEPAAVGELLGGMFGSMRNRLSVQRDRFVGAARVQLGGEVNEVPAEVLRNYLGSLGSLADE